MSSPIYVSFLYGYLSKIVWPLCMSTINESKYLHVLMAKCLSTKSAQNKKYSLSTAVSIWFFSAEALSKISDIIKARCVLSRTTWKFWKTLISYILGAWAIHMFLLQPVEFDNS